MTLKPPEMTTDTTRSPLTILRRYRCRLQSQAAFRGLPRSASDFRPLSPSTEAPPQVEVQNLSTDPRTRPLDWPVLRVGATAGALWPVRRRESAFASFDRIGGISPVAQHQPPLGPGSSFGNADRPDGSKCSSAENHQTKKNNRRRVDVHQWRHRTASRRPQYISPCSVGRRQVSQRAPHGNEQNARPRGEPT